MIRIRRFEERCVRLYSSEAVCGFLHLYIGEEAVAAGLLGALEPEDAVVSTYRDHGHALARGVPMGPVFLELRTYRFRAHSMYDADRYRTKTEIEEWKVRDPIPRLFDELCATGTLKPEDRAALETAVGAEIDAAVTAAEAAPLEPVADLTRHVYAERK
ncbi:thiamine pyrophosphate-dependent enzyme [Nocardia sp. SYP-A9097]|uniref:thiamine pyrophosphate-dependent enzyme n=1 Tax=Nocardia sp. SYP-A9097 TaxID=2663237 RepID=UPI001891B66F|nr:thiamine pyrophosphate-dependent enzyme [Nocardia sp. SYP-A9097]